MVGLGIDSKTLFTPKFQALSMAFVYGDTNYHLRVEKPCVDLDHLYPELPHVLLQVKIFFQVERRFIDCLPDGGTTDLLYFLYPVKETSCTFIHPEFFVNISGTCIKLSEMLSGLEIDQQCLKQIMETIIRTGRAMYNCVQNRGRNVLALHVCITKKQDVYVHYDRYLMDLALGESAAEFERTNYGMVPANQSALEKLLKTVKIEDDPNQPTKRSPQNCTICLEEFEKLHAVSMPCSHLFHGECIFRWLKQSHYCPVCRYEMPT